MVRVELRCDVVTACLLPAHAPSVSYWQQPPVSAVIESVLCLSGPSSGSLLCSPSGRFCSWFALLVSFRVAGLLPANGVL